MRVLIKSERQQYVDAYAKYLVDHDLDWFTEAAAYLRTQWRENPKLSAYFSGYREFAEAVGYVVNGILLGKQQRLPPPRLVVDNTRKRGD